MNWIPFVQLVAVLREVKYLEIRAKESVPEAAKSLFEKNETLRQFRENLDLVCKWYNKISTTTLDIEKPLIEGQLAEIDQQLEEGRLTTILKAPNFHVKIR